MGYEENPSRSKTITKHCVRSKLPARLAAVLMSATVLAGIVSCDYEPPEITGLDADTAFVLAVIPVLQDQCENCHFPGGPMYKKMPFDDMGVVGGLEDEVVTRLKGQGRERVAEWLVVWKREQEATEPRIQDPE